MSGYLGELLGTLLLILIGDGVVAGVCLNKSKAKDGGWITITVGWALAVTLGVLIFGPISGAHFNPAVTLALASIGDFPWSQVPGYIICQMIGAFIGACIVYLQYKQHFDVTDDQDTKRGVFCTAPAIRGTFYNFISEVIGTFVLVFAIIGVANTAAVEGFGPINVGMIILAIGVGLGGTTGYAINPARDLGPRIAHAILPIKNKGNSDWSYAWIPVVGPIVGGVLAALLCNIIF